MTYVVITLISCYSVYHAYRIGKLTYYIVKYKHGQTKLDEAYLTGVLAGKDKVITDNPYKGVEQIRLRINWQNGWIKTKNESLIFKIISKLFIYSTFDKEVK